MPRGPSGQGKKGSKVSRERILRAALVEFARHGFEGATTAAVARVVGVTQPLIHYHFGSKDALWRAVVDAAFEPLMQVVEALPRDPYSNGDARENLKRSFRIVLEFSATHPELSRLVLAEAVVPGPRLEWMAARYLKPLAQRLECRLDEGRREGYFRDLPHLGPVLVCFGALPHLFDGGPLVTMFAGVDPSSPEDRKRFTDTLLEVFVAGLLTTPAKGK